ncbi:MAG TPA: ABC transporter substrate-binding protein [Xanthobacteraceae bacterium]|jgi:putative ABC transport system substrate-binding protein
MTVKRREFITLLGSAAAWPLAARAQQAKRIAVVTSNDPGEKTRQADFAAFEQTLRTLGWRNGRNLHIDYRWVGGDIERTRTYAAELVELAPDLIVAGSTSVLRAVTQATPDIPIIFMGVSDPVAQGFVTNLAHPEGNITGFSAYEFSIAGKWLDLLKQFSPDLPRVALLFNPMTSPQYKLNLASLRAAARTFGVEVMEGAVTSSVDIERVIAELAQEPRGGFIVANDQFLRSQHLHDVVDLAARYRVPAIYAQREFVEAGGLMRYGNVEVETYRAVASYVDRILKGAKPGELPVQLPSKYELVLNLKTAKALGLTVPLTLRARADEVIE